MKPYATLSICSQLERRTTFDIDHDTLKDLVNALAFAQAHVEQFAAGDGVTVPDRSDATRKAIAWIIKASDEPIREHRHPAWLPEQLTTLSTGEQYNLDTRAAAATLLVCLGYPMETIPASGVAVTPPLTINITTLKDAREAAAAFDAPAIKNPGKGSLVQAEFDERMVTRYVDVIARPPTWFDASIDGWREGASFNKTKGYWELTKGRPV